MMASSQIINLLAFLDPTGLLEEGQIYCRSSDNKWPDKAGNLHDVLIGSVLVSNYRASNLVGQVVDKDIIGNTHTL